MPQASLANRVYETSLTAGAGALTLAGAATPRHRTFLGSLGAAATTFYLISHRTLGEWEAGVGLVNGDGTLTRVTVLNNHLGTTATVSFSAGTKDVFQDVPASKMLALDTDSTTLTLPGAIRLNSIAYTFPASQAANRFLKTDGAGNLSWALPTELLALTDLSDVAITVPAAGEILRYSGAAWVNSTDGSALTALNASNLASGTVATARVAGSYTGITGLGVVTVGTWNANAIADAYLATIATAGKVSNSATTATALNTVSAIVARDGAGNFAAGTITAALTGNASTATTLQTARNINGVSFNGSADITVTAAAGTLTGIALNATVVTSSLTTVGSLISGSLAAGFGNINIGASSVTAGAASFTTGAFSSTVSIARTGGVALILDVQSATSGSRGARILDNSGVGGGGRGSGISFGGISNDTGPVMTEYVRLIGLKTNATQGNTKGYFSLSVDNGSGLVEYMTIQDTGATRLTGPVGIGTAALVNSRVEIAGTGASNAGYAWGVSVAHTLDSGATFQATAFYGITKTTAAAYTVPSSYVFRADTPTVGVGSGITTQYGFFAANQGATGVTHAYGVYIAAQSGALTTNIGLYNAGTTTLVGVVTLSAALIMAAAQKLYLDSGGDTYLHESSANVLTAVVGAANALILTATTAQFAGTLTVGSHLSVPAASAIYLNGQGGDSYITEDGGTAVRIASSGAVAAAFLSNGGAIGNVAPSTTTALIVPASTTAISSMRVPHGVAPTSPVDGDWWTTTAGLYIRINGVTKTVTLS